MEKSLVKKGFTPARVLPFALALVGLVCASWLSINNETKSANLKKGETHDVLAQDTSINTRSDDHEESSEQESGESVPMIYSYDHSFDATFFPPPVPTDAWDVLHAMPAFRSDSIPGFFVAPDGDWGKFEKEFTEKFQDEFGEFFKKNSEQFEKMMSELREEHNAAGVLAYRRMHDLNPEELKALQEQMLQLGPMIENLEDMMPRIVEEAQAMQEQALLHSHEALAQSDLARTHADIARIQEEMMRDQELIMQEQERNLRAYEEEMIDQLRTDGYLEKDEKVNDLHIRNGQITVNGKKVKEEDEKKYRAIIERFNRGWHTPRRAE